MTDEGRGLFDESLIARRRLRIWVAAAAGLLLLIRVAAEVTPVMRVPDLTLLNAWQSLRATERPSPQVVIVGLDEKSIQRFGPPAWPRSEYVPLIERLAAAGAQVIGFDFTFGALEREAENNARMAEAMRAAGNVVFGYEFTNFGDPSPPGVDPPVTVRASALPRARSVALPPAPGLIAPEPILAEAAAAIGHVHTVESEDGRIRAQPLVARHGDRVYLSLAVQIARIYTGTPLEEVVLTDGLLGMGEWDIPVSPAGEVLLNWPAGGEQAFPQYSFLDVVRGDVPDEAFHGKAVLVAGTAPGLDDRDFPFAVEAPGVLAYATFLDNVFRFDFAQAPLWAWGLEWGLFLAALGLGVWLLPRLPTAILLVGVPILALILLGTAGFLYVQQGLWIKAVYPEMALLLPLGLVVVLRLTASERETRDIAAEKVENQKQLGLSFQEKGLLDMALAQFAKLPFTDDTKSLYMNLGLDYENRGQRDKAFLAYKRVFDADPAFEDVAQRMEHLSQGGAGSSLFAAPTGRVGRAPTGRPMGTPPPTTPAPARPAPTTPAPTTSDSPISDLVSTPLPMDDDGEPTIRESEADTAGSYGTEIPTQRAPDSRLAPTVATGGRRGGPGGPAVTPPPPGGRVGPGSRFGERFEVVRHLGRGGMGDVYEATDTTMNRRVAIKTIRDDKELSPQQVIELRQRFYREADTAGQLTHPNIVTVYDRGEDLGMAYIVMEFVEGYTLTQWMKGRRLNVAQIKHVIYNAAMGLQYAHEHGVFHRDVKPDNIMVGKTGTVKVMDFGIARVVESTLTKTGSVMGTPAYMSPEQVHGHKIDARSDIFSLAVILYELLTGRRPFTGDTISSQMFAVIQAEPTVPSAVDTKVDKVWDAILGVALAKSREDRYQTAKDFGEAVRDAPAR
jgi:CHASE2 domain-containing sensor protein/tRNA A-37 threonylcarbamoyl transferase component Bud32